MRLKISAIAVLLPLALLCMADGNATSADADWQTARRDARNRQRRVIYDNDGDDCLAYPRNKDFSIENYLALRTTYLKGSVVDTVFYTPTSAGFGYLSLLTDVGDRLMVPSASPTTKNIAPQLFESGTDTLKLQLDFARKNNLELFASLRMNDTHDAGDRPDHPHPLFPPYKRKHPELLFGAWNRQPPYGPWSAVDYDKPEIREYFIRLVDEIFARYDVDGIAFDFCRQPNLFASVAWGKPIEQRQLDAMTALFTQVRSLAETYGRKRGRPILIAIRVPDSAAYCRGIGIDLETWMRRDLVDLVIGGGNFRLAPWRSSVELCHKYQVKFYSSIDMPQFVESPNRLYRRAPISYHAREAAAFAAGVDGNFYFNLFSRHAVENIMTPDMNALRYLDKRYYITDRYLFDLPEHKLKNGEKLNLLPVLHPAVTLNLVPGKNYQYVLEFGDDLAALRQENKMPRLTGIVNGQLSNPAALEIKSSGVPWRYLNSDGDYHYYRIPDNALKVGANPVEFSIAASSSLPSATMTVIMAGDELLKGEKQPPWRRFFLAHDSANAEKIVDRCYLMTDSGEGRANLLYPLPETKNGNSIVKFDCRVIGSSDDRAVVLRFADGEHVEILSLTPGEVKLLNSKTSVKLDTADRLHNYELRFADCKVQLWIDGNLQLSAPFTTPVRAAEEDSDFSGMALMPPPGFAERSILIGSLSEKGTGAACWRNLAVNSSPIRIKDLAVEVEFPPQTVMRPVDSWQYQSQGVPLLAAGRNPYSNNQMAAEIELKGTPQVTAMVSNGGSMCSLQINPLGLRFPDGGQKVMFNSESAQHLVCRIDLDGTLKTAVVFLNGNEYAGQIRMLTNVSTFLKTPAAASLSADEQQIIRNGGIVLRDTSASTVIEGLRACVYPPSPTVKP